MSNTHALTHARTISDPMERYVLCLKNLDRSRFIIPIVGAYLLDASETEPVSSKTIQTRSGLVAGAVNIGFRFMDTYGYSRIIEPARRIRKAQTTETLIAPTEALREVSTHTTIQNELQLKALREQTGLERDEVLAIALGNLSTLGYLSDNFERPTEMVSRLAEVSA
jgi:hypothetical protein